MKVLLLSVSAKVTLIEAFLEALAAYDGLVLGSDLNNNAPALRLCHAAVSLPASDTPQFGSALLDLCRREAIDLVVPTRDGELAVVAALASDLKAQGTKALVPSPKAVSSCLDKAKFSDLCDELGLATPERVDPTREDAYPLFARPRFGSASQGARQIASKNAFDAVSDRADLITQELIRAPEYSIDLLSDFDGVSLQAVSRLRLQVVGGESQRTQIKQVESLVTQAMKLGNALGLVGHSVLQAFLDPLRGPLWIEANARFGGASIASIRAGLNSPSRILGLLRGDITVREPLNIQDGMLMERYAEDC